MKKIVLLIGVAVSTLVANAQVLVGVNTKLNNYTLGVDANNIGYYGSVSYGKVQEGKQAPLFRYDYVAPELHPIHNNYKVVSSSNTETNTTIVIGKVLNNDNDVRVGVHIGVNFNQKDIYNNYNDLGGFSVLNKREVNNNLVGGVYVNYYIGWVKVDVTSNKQVSTSVGLFIPLVYEKSCLR